MVQHTLRHRRLSPDGRLARLVFAEKSLAFEPAAMAITDFQTPEGVWSAVAEPSLEAGERRISGVWPLIEWAEETASEPTLLPGDAHERAAARALTRRAQEVLGGPVSALLDERTGLKGPPDAARIRDAIAAAARALAGLDALLQDRSWLAGETRSLADFAAAAHISTIDYLGDVDWRGVPAVRDWYALMKSRPSFRPILADRLPSRPPAAHYDDLDF